MVVERLTEKKKAEEKEWVDEGMKDIRPRGLDGFNAIHIVWTIHCCLTDLCGGAGVSLYDQSNNVCSPREVWLVI